MYLRPPFVFPFLAIFSPNREPVHRLEMSGWTYDISDQIECDLKTEYSVSFRQIKLHSRFQDLIRIIFSAWMPKH